MSFVSMFDLVNFDDAGHIKPVYKDGKMIVSLAQAQANFLYLLTKYNRNFLVSKNLKPSDFFKKELGDILKNVEQGEDYYGAYQKVLENCVKEIRDLSRLAMPTEKGLLILMNQMTPLVGTEFERIRLDKAQNVLDENYRLNKLASTYENAIDKRIADYIAGQGTHEDKQTIFNSLVNLNIAYARLVNNDKIETTSRRATESRSSRPDEMGIGVG